MGRLNSLYIGRVGCLCHLKEPSASGWDTLHDPTDLWALSPSQQDMPGTHMLNQVFSVLWKKSPSVPEATISRWPPFHAGWR